MQPPQRHMDGPARAERNAKILKLAVAGMKERAIADQFELAQSTVHEIIASELRARIDVPAEELISLREARLEDLYSRSYAAMIAAPRGSKAWALAWDRCLRAEESLRKLKGVDAPEAMVISLERRSDEESMIATEALLAAMADLSPAQRAYRLEIASRRLIELEGGTPDGPPPQPPEPEATSTEAPIPWPVKIEGREYVWINGRYRELGPVYRPGEGGEIILDAEFVEGTDDDLTAQQGPEGTRPHRTMTRKL